MLLCRMYKFNYSRDVFTRVILLLNSSQCLTWAIRTINYNQVEIDLNSQKYYCVHTLCYKQESLLPWDVFGALILISEDL